MNSDIVECVGWVSRVATICAGLRKYWWIALEQIVRGSTHPEEHELAEAPLLWENFSQKYSEVIFILWSQYWLIRVILKICSLQRKPDNCNANSSPFPHPPPQQHQASHRHTFQLDIILLPQIFPALVALQLKFGSICMLTVGSPSAGGCPVSGVTKWSSPCHPGSQSQCVCILTSHSQLRQSHHFTIRPTFALPIIIEKRLLEIIYSSINASNVLQTLPEAPTNINLSIWHTSLGKVGHFWSICDF